MLRAEDVFYTADSHYSHAAILKYCDRDFSSIEAHDETLIKNWNNKVPKTATVFHLGDIAFAQNEQD